MLEEKQEEAYFAPPPPPISGMIGSKFVGIRQSCLRIHDNALIDLIMIRDPNFWSTG